MSERVIIAEGLKKSFSGIRVLDGVFFSLRRKENVTILGRSGAGKSVLLKSFVGLIEPDEGRLNVLGNDIMAMTEEELIMLRRKIGYLFQEGALYDSMTVRENVGFSLKRQVKKLPDQEIERAVKHALEQVGLSAAIDKMPDELSGGMRKRVALARTLIPEPEIILYDEPTAGLDPVTAREINELILEMRKKLGISAVIATHDMLSAKMTSDRVAILHEGKIAAEGTYEELERSEEQFVKSFFK
jgi:phospholipid/cholesterol/gamma-HCH transport system ATP-binding protein